jgi:hypothetical protein
MPRTATGSELQQSILEMLQRGVIGSFLPSLDAEQVLSDDLRSICREARRQGIRVESLIIAFKDVWRTIPEVRTLPQGSQGPEFLSHVITLGIAEFYASDRAD